MAANQRGGSRARKLALADPAQFQKRRETAQSLNAALDDGFTMIDREELHGLQLLLIAWEIEPGFSGRPYATVWAMVERGDDVQRVKFQDGGRSIPAQLRYLAENGRTTDVLVRLWGENYVFTDQETGEEKDATSYRFLDPNEPDPETDPGF